jgi:hypothetical protein
LACWSQQIFAGQQILRWNLIDKLTSFLQRPKENMERSLYRVGELTALTYRTDTSCRSIEMASHCFHASHPITTYSYSYGEKRYGYSTTTNLSYFFPLIRNSITWVKKSALFFSWI